MIGSKTYFTTVESRTWKMELAKRVLFFNFLLPRRTSIQCFLFYFSRMFTHSFNQSYLLLASEQKKSQKELIKSDIWWNSLRISSYFIYHKIVQKNKMKNSQIQEHFLLSFPLLLPYEILIFYSLSSSIKKRLLIFKGIL